MVAETAFIVMPEFEVKADKLEAFLAAAREDAENSVAVEPGCLQFDISVGASESLKKVAFYEVYTSAEAFDAHLNTPHLARFRQALELVERELPVRFMSRHYP